MPGEAVGDKAMAWVKVIVAQNIEAASACMRRIGVELDYESLEREEFHYSRSLGADINGRRLPERLSRASPVCGALP